MVQYLIRTYESDDIIAQAEAELVNFRQLSKMNEETYASTLWEKPYDAAPYIQRKDERAVYRGLP